MESRVYGFYYDDEDENTKSNALIPMADMVNHDSIEYQLDYGYDSELEGFTLTANKDIKKGEELFIKYHTGGCANFFLNYGFVNAKAPYKLTFFIRLNQDSDPMYLSKKKLLIKYKISPV